MKPYLFKELAKAKTDHALCRCLVRSTGIAGDVKTWDSKAATGSGNADHVLKNNVRLLSITTIADGLITDSIDRSINLLSAIGLDDQIYSVTLGEVNGCAANLLGCLKTFGNTVYNKHSQFKSVEVSVRNSDVLSLATSVRTHGNVAISTSSKSRVYAGTESSLSLFAIAAAAVSDVKGHDDTVPFLEESDTLTELFDYSHILMAWVVMPGCAAVRPSYMLFAIRTTDGSLRT
ncbi:hypothetical protein HG531_000473 [Fusarium graminearum]|nr:hypothetical protein HG531_000473 [Fusarium graminearum]